METIILEILKSHISNLSILSILSYVFIAGLVLFFPFYIKRIKNYMKDWKEMGSFDRIIFLFLLGLLIAIPSLIISLSILFIVFFFYCIFAPHISGESIDLFKPVLFVMTFLYITCIFFKKKNNELSWDLLRKIFYSSVRWFFILFIILIVEAILIIIFGIATKCIVT